MIKKPVVNEVLGKFFKKDEPPKALKPTEVPPPKQDRQTPFNPRHYKWYINDHPRGDAYGDWDKNLERWWWEAKRHDGEKKTGTAHSESEAKKFAVAFLDQKAEEVKPVNRYDEPAPRLKHKQPSGGGGSGGGGLGAGILDKLKDKYGSKESPEQTDRRLEAGREIEHKEQPKPDNQIDKAQDGTVLAYVQNNIKKGNDTYPLLDVYHHYQRYAKYHNHIATDMEHFANVLRANRYSVGRHWTGADLSVKYMTFVRGTQSYKESIQLTRLRHAVALLREGNIEGFKTAITTELYDRAREEIEARRIVLAAPMMMEAPQPPPERPNLNRRQWHVPWDDVAEGLGDVPAWLWPLMGPAAGVVGLGILLNLVVQFAAMTFDGVEVLGKGTWYAIAHAIWSRSKEGKEWKAKQVADEAGYKARVAEIDRRLQAEVASRIAARKARKAAKITHDAALRKLGKKR